MPASAADYALIAGTEIAEKDPAQARLLYIYRLAPAVRRYIDGKTPDWPVVRVGSGLSAKLTTVASWPEYVLTAWTQAGGWQIPARGLLMKVNLVPALIRSSTKPWAPVSWAEGGHLLVPIQQSAAFHATKWIAMQKSLLWDSTAGYSTIKALVDIVTLKPSYGEITPALLVHAMAALAAGEPYVLAKHEAVVREAIEAAEAMAPWPKWGRGGGPLPWSDSKVLTPSMQEREAFATSLRNLQSALEAGRAIKGQAAAGFDALLANLENAMANAPGDSMPPPEASWWSRRATWQQVGIVLAGAGAAYYSYKHVKQRRATRNLLPA